MFRCLFLDWTRFADDWTFLSISTYSRSQLMRIRSFCIPCLFAVCTLVRVLAAPEAIAVLMGDQHSAYERTAQFVAHIDRIQRENPGTPLAILLNGDLLEYGNVVARRTSGAVDFAMFAALAARAPTVINLGNHEPEFYDVPETVHRLRSAGLTVISGNLRHQSTGEPFAPAFVRLKLGAHELTIVGVATDRLSTYRVAVRPQLDITDPAVWAKENFPPLLRSAAVPVVLSHSGLKADRAMLPLVPDGTLFAGAHDHLRFIHRDGKTAYVHSGSWMDFMSIARLQRKATGLEWDVEQIPIRADDPADPKLAPLIAATLKEQLTSAERVIVGRTTRALAPGEAAMFAVEAARRVADADAALIGGTTFGAGLPAGEVTRFAFDACVRFDGTLFIAELDSDQLQQLLARGNQNPSTPFAERSGENLVIAGPPTIDPARRYRLVTTNWVAKNARTYLGENAPTLTERPDLKLKAAVLAALQP